jgi:hypothetical protein
MASNVKNNLDELKCIMQEVKFYKTKEDKHSDNN